MSKWSVVAGLKSSDFIYKPCPAQAQKVSDDLLQKIGSQNRRALDLVAAKCYYYHSRVYEFLNQLDVVRRWAVFPRFSLGSFMQLCWDGHFCSLMTQFPAHALEDSYVTPGRWWSGHAAKPASAQLLAVQFIWPGWETCVQIGVPWAGQ